MSAAPGTIAVYGPEQDRPSRHATWRRSLRHRRTRAGLALSLPVIALALIGPLLAPHSSTALVGPPYAPISSDTRLGTDYIGHDVLSRLLFGGFSLLWMSLTATALAALIGVTLGLVAGYSRGWLDDVIMRVLDLLFAFPQLVLVLLFVSVVGPKLWLVTLLVAVSLVPGLARITRGLTVDASSREYVAAAEAVGIPRRRILARELLPNLTTPLAVEISLRLTWAIVILAGISFLGFGVAQPQADWGLMTNENRDGIAVQPWAILAPILCIAMLTIGTSLIAEGFARTMAGIDRHSGRS